MSKYKIVLSILAISLLVMVSASVYHFTQKEEPIDGFLSENPPEDLPESQFFANEETQIDGSVALNELLPLKYETLLSSDEKKQAYEESKDDEIVKKLQKEVDSIIEGSFGWNYQNKDNKEAFLKYRNGEYYFGGDLYSADVLYEKIHNKLNEHQLYFDYQFNYNEEDVYIHPERGGYIVSGLLSLSYQSDKDTEIDHIPSDQIVEIPIEIEFLYSVEEMSEWGVWSNEPIFIGTIYFNE